MNQAKSNIYSIGEHKSQDTISLLEDLLKMAKEGEIVGLAVITLNKGHQIGQAYTGEVCNNPLLAIHALNSLLCEIVEKTKA